MSWVLRAAGASDLLWASASLCYLPLSKLVFGGSPHSLPGRGWELCVEQAILLSILGLGLMIAASEPYRHWPVVLMGLLGKLMAGAGLAWEVWQGLLSPAALLPAFAAGWLWLPPLGYILYRSHEALLCRRRTVSPEVLKFALRRRTHYGVSLEELSRLSPVLLVFLRHAGCTFCREALADLASQRAEIEKQGSRLVLVHMSEPDAGERFIAGYGLESVPRISDPDRTLYRAFGLTRGGLVNLFGPKVWWRGVEAGLFGGHGIGMLEGDGFQMPGVFLLFHGEIIRGYRHQSAADRPDYLALVQGRDYAAPEFRDR